MQVWAFPPLIIRSSELSRALSLSPGTPFLSVTEQFLYLFSKVKLQLKQNEESVLGWMLHFCTRGPWLLVGSRAPERAVALGVGTEGAVAPHTTSSFPSVMRSRLSTQGSDSSGPLKGT